MLPDFERADRIGEYWSYPASRASAELLIDCEEDRTLRAVLVGMLRERAIPRPDPGPDLTGPCHASRHISGKGRQDVHADAGYAAGTLIVIGLCVLVVVLLGYCVYFFFFKKGDIDDFG